MMKLVLIGLLSFTYLSISIAAPVDNLPSQPRACFELLSSPSGGPNPFELGTAVKLNYDTIEEYETGLADLYEKIIALDLVGSGWHRLTLAPNGRLPFDKTIAMAFGNPEEKSLTFIYAWSNGVVPINRKMVFSTEEKPVTYMFAVQNKWGAEEIIFGVPQNALLYVR